MEPKREDGNESDEEDADELDDDDEVGSQGNRSNLIFTTSRINPVNFQLGNIYIDGVNSEVEIINPQRKKGVSRRDAWVLDTSLDNVPKELFERIGEEKGQQDSTILKFGSQEDVWDKIKDILEAQLSLNGSTVGVIALGPHGSGKSHTLFGSMNHSRDDGIVPRAIRLLFSPLHEIHASHVLLQMYLIINEEFVDLFDAAHCSYKSDGELAYSNSLGSIVMPVNSLIASTAEECLDFVTLGMMMMASVLSNGPAFWTHSNLVISTTVFSKEKNRYSRVLFVESASLHTPKPVQLSVDRFAGQSQSHASSRELYNCVKSIPVGAPVVMPMSETQPIQEKPRDFQNSVLTYILQDCLIKYPDCVVIGCLRAQANSFDDNFAVLDFLNRLDTGSESRRSHDVVHHPHLSDLPHQLQQEISECERIIEDNTRALALYKEVLTDATERLAKNDFGQDNDCDEDDFLKLKETTQNLIDMYTELNVSAENGIRFYESKCKYLRRFELGIRVMLAVDNLESSQACFADDKVDVDALLEFDESLIPPIVYPLRFDAECVHSFAAPSEVAEGFEPDINMSVRLREKLLQVFNYHSRQVEAPKVADTGNDDDISIITTESRSKKRVKIVEQEGEENEEVPAGPLFVTEFVSIVARLKFYLIDVGFDPDSRMFSLANQLINSFSGQVEAFSRGGSFPVEIETIGEGFGDSIQLDSLGKSNEVAAAAELLLTEGDLTERNEDTPNELSSKRPPMTPNSRGAVTPTAIAPPTPIPRPLSTNALSRPTTSLETDEMPYLVSICRGALFAAELARIPLKRGLTLIKGTDVPFLHSITRHGNDLLAEYAKHTLLLSDEDEHADAGDDDEATFDSGVRLQDSDVGNFNMPMSSTKMREQTSAGSGFGKPAKSMHHIYVNGPGIIHSHARFSQQGGVNIHITPNHISTGSGSSIVIVNGASITEATVLKDGDLIQLGYARFFQICIPRLRHDDEDGESEAGDGKQGTLSGRSSRARTPAEKIMRRQQQLITEANNKAKSSARKSRKEGKTSSKKPKLKFEGESARDLLSENGDTARSVGAASSTSKDVNTNPADLNIDEDDLLLLSAYEKCMVCFYQTYLRLSLRAYETARRHSAHLSVDREGASIATNKEKNELMLMEEFEPTYEEVTAMLSGITHLDRAKICETIAISILLSYLSKDMRRGVQFEVRLRQVPSSDRNNSQRWGTFMFQVPASYRPAVSKQQAISAKNSNNVLEDKTLFAADILCTTSDINGNNEGCWWWTLNIVLERLALINQMRDCFLGPQCSKNSISLEKLYPEEIDPFLDTLDDELIGVAFLYLDPIQYLLDIHNSLPIINYAGKTAGSLHVRVRTWIDKVDTQPNYISIDKEVNIADFINHTCLIRIHVDSMRHLPKNLCSATYLYFKFFFHSAVYKTPRYCGSAVNPNIEHTIAIDQKITRDFVDYIRSGSIEIEIFGKRHDPIKTTAASTTLPKRAPVGEPVIKKLEGDDAANVPGASLDQALAAAADADNNSVNSKPGDNSNALSGNDVEPNDKESERDQLIAYLQRQVEELSTENSKKEKALAQAKKAASIAQLDKAQADIRADRALKEKEEAENKVINLERALAEAQKKIEILSRPKEPPPAPMPVAVVNKTSNVCVIA